MCVCLYVCVCVCVCVCVYACARSRVHSPSLFPPPPLHKSIHQLSSCNLVRGLRIKNHPFAHYKAKRHRNYVHPVLKFVLFMNGINSVAHAVAVHNTVLTTVYRHDTCLPVWRWGRGGGCLASVSWPMCIFIYHLRDSKKIFLASKDKNKVLKCVTASLAEWLRCPPRQRETQVRFLLTPKGIFLGRVIPVT